MTCDNEKDSGFLTSLPALLAGVSAGIAVGLLIAPKSGAKLRSDIQTTADGYLDAARQKAEGLRNSAVNFAQRGVREAKQTVAGAAEAGAVDAHKAIDHTVAAVNDGARKGHEVVDSALGAVRAAAQA